MLFPVKSSRFIIKSSLTTIKSARAIAELPHITTKPMRSSVKSKLQMNAAEIGVSEISFQSSPSQFPNYLTWRSWHLGILAAKNLFNPSLLNDQGIDI
jgi:hypothetical protein